MPTDEEVRHFQRYYPESNLMHWYNKGYADALREVRRDVGRDFGTARHSDFSSSGLPGRKVKKRTKNKWNIFVKKFRFRKKKKSESQAKYLGLKMKAAGRAYRKKNRSKK